MGEVVELKEVVCEKRNKQGHRNATVVYRNVYISKFIVTYTLRSFTIEVHASSVTIFIHFTNAKWESQN